MDTRVFDACTHTTRFVILLSRQSFDSCVQEQHSPCTFIWRAKWSFSDVSAWQTPSDSSRNLPVSPLGCPHGYSCVGFANVYCWEFFLGERTAINSVQLSTFTCRWTQLLDWASAHAGRLVMAISLQSCISGGGLSLERAFRWLPRATVSEFPQKLETLYLENSLRFERNWK